MTARTSGALADLRCGEPPWSFLFGWFLHTYTWLTGLWHQDRLSWSSRTSDASYLYTQLSREDPVAWSAKVLNGQDFRDHRLNDLWRERESAAPLIVLVKKINRYFEWYMVFLYKHFYCFIPIMVKKNWMKRNVSKKWPLNQNIKDIINWSMWIVIRRYNWTFWWTLDFSWFSSFAVKEAHRTDLLIFYNLFCFQENIAYNHVL